MAKILRNIVFDLKSFTLDMNYIYTGFSNDFINLKFINRLKINLTRINNLRKYIFKKYIYTINHKRIAINYLFFSM
jgi:hypothetical protein